MTTSEDAALQKSAGVAYLPDVDQLFVKLFHGSGGDRLAAEFTSTARTDDETTFTCHLSPDDQLLSVVIHEASSKVPAQLWKDLADHQFTTSPVQARNRMHVEWYTPLPDVAQVPFFPGALDVFREVEVCQFHADLAPIGLLKARSHRVVGLLIERASVRLAAELLPPLLG